MIARIEALDQTLVSHGFHPMSPWWRAELARFLSSGRRRWAIRAGRRSGKSSTLCRLAVAQALWGKWSVPAGDVAVVAFVSVSRDEASARLRTIVAILKALGLKHDERDGEVELLDRPVLFKIFACSAKTSVGFTGIAVIGDEVARWESRETGANPAREVIGSLAPTLATQPHGFLVLSSSAWSTDDYHAERVAEGDTGHQVVSTATTWEANPTISEDRTHELEPDPRIWSREYANQPGATVSAALDPDDIAACVELRFAGLQSRPWLAIDASSLRGDSFAYMVGCLTPAGIAVTYRDAWSGNELRATTLDAIAADLTNTAALAGVSTVWGDQREEAGLQSAFTRFGVGFVSFAWNETSKDACFQLLRRLLRERRISLPRHDTLLKECRDVRAHLRPSGKVGYDTNGRDHLSCLITMLHAQLAGHIPLLGASALYQREPRQRPMTLRAMGLGGFCAPAVSRRQPQTQGVLSTPYELRGLPPRSNNQLRRRGGY